MKLNNLALGSGYVEMGPEEIAQLKREKEKLEQDLAHAQMEAKHAKANAEQSVRNLRASLTGLYTGLKQLFGEMDAIAPNADNQDGASPAANTKWDVWRQRFPGKGAQIIDLLLIQQQMNVRQLCAALKCDPRTLAQYIHKLTKADLVQKNGKDYSLKPI
jgi:hypothetical protein